jgi:hypothetical protein
MRKSVYLIIVISVLAAYFQYEVLVYQSLAAALVWSNRTLYLNVVANRMHWQNCEWYGRCEVDDHPPAWRVIRKGEMAFRG